MKKKVAMKAMAAALAVTTVLGVVPVKSAYAYYTKADNIVGEKDENSTTFEYYGSYFDSVDKYNKENKAFCKTDKAFAMPKKQTHTYVWGKNYGVNPDKITYVRYIDLDNQEVYHYGKRVGSNSFDQDNFSLLQKGQADLVALDDRVDELNKKAKTWNKPIIAYNKKASAWNKKAATLNKKNGYEYYGYESIPWNICDAEWTVGHPDLKRFKKNQKNLFKFCKGYTKHGVYYPRGYDGADYCPLMKYYTPAYKVKNGKLYYTGVAARTDDPTQAKNATNVKGYVLDKYAKIFTLSNTSDAAINALGEQLDKRYKSIGYGIDEDNKESQTYVIKMKKVDTLKALHKLQDYFYNNRQGIIPLELMFNPFHAKDEKGNYYIVLDQIGNVDGDLSEYIIANADYHVLTKYLKIAFKSAKENIRKAAEEDPSIISKCKDFEKWQSFADIKEPVNRMIMFNYSTSSFLFDKDDGDRIFARVDCLPWFWGMSCSGKGTLVVTTYKGKKYIYDVAGKFIPYTENKWRNTKESVTPVEHGEWWFEDDYRTHKGCLVEE